MDQIFTLLSVLGAILLVGAYGFFMSGEWVPTVRDLLMPEHGPAGAIVNNVGYAAALLATCWILISLAT